MKKIKFLSREHTLSGNLLIPNESKKVGVLILHGGGKATKERFIELQEILALEKYSSLAFDFRGVGESTGNFKDGSLQNRLVDTKSAHDELSKYVDSIIVIGASMGGHVAARLTEFRSVDKLVLMYAAAYSKNAEDKLLNEEFSRAIREANSWKDSNAFLAIKKYNGQVLAIYGENENVIPKDIQSAYKDLIRDKEKFIVLPNAPHLILSEENTKQQAIGEIVSFLNND